MACILHIETATEVCSVAISLNNEIIFEQIDYDGPSHAKLLAVFTEKAIEEIRSKGISLDAVAVSCGPGSYTGLRIGVSHAKGLCYGLNVPMIAIPTLTILADSVFRTEALGETDLLCPMIDARRMEVYDVLFDKNMNLVRKVEADIIDESSFADLLATRKIYFFGNGAAKCMDILTASNVTYLENKVPLARNMMHLAEEAFEKQDFADVAYFEPHYLKEFVGTIPKNKILPPH